jgi:DNA repair ATPase RecN
MSDRIVLRSLTFTGPDKASAVLTFGDKLTLIWGASNTGKSFTLKALDFMFGGSGASGHQRTPRLRHRVAGAHTPERG